MGVVKINLHSLHAERSLEAKGGKVTLNTNVNLKHLEEVSVPVDGKKGLKFNFVFTWTYGDKHGKIEVGCQVLYVEDATVIDEILAGWSKNKQVESKYMESIVNAAWHKGTMQAIKVSEEVGLPSPFPLPKVKAAKK